MRKLSLKLEDLSVESFTTEGDAAVRGTVVGLDESTGPEIVCSCIPVTAFEDTCQLTCGQTCLNTCDCGTNDFRCGASQPGQRICM